MRTRALGRTGHRRSLITFGGIAVMEQDQTVADRVVAEAIDAGVNGFDVAPSYGDAEDKLGHALVGYRDRVFLQGKTAQRTREGAAQELRQTLRKLRTDHLDLYQLHALSEPDQLEQVFAPRGALEALVEARDAGFIRFIGISSHRPTTLIAAMERFPFDTVMLPVNFVLEHRLKFAAAAIALARRRGIGVIALKALAQRPWRRNERRKYEHCWYKPIDEEELLRMALCFTLSQRVTTAVPPGNAELLRRAIAVAQQYSPPDLVERLVLDVTAQRLKPIFDQR